MRSSDVERITAFDHRFARAQASDVVELAWGFAVLQAEFPLSHHHNRLVVTAAAPGAEVLSAADGLLGGAGLGHRRVSVDGTVGEALVADFEAAGYRHEVVASMVYAGAAPGPAPEVQEVSFEAVRPWIIEGWELDIPDAPAELPAQLADRTELCSRGAEQLRLAVYDGDEVAAHADLYLDRSDDIAQFENLATRPGFRRRGHGRALVRGGLRRSRDAGAELVFLTAGLGDWPYQWYLRLGFIDVATTHHFTRDADE